MKYASVKDIIDDYFGVRYRTYEKRKQHMIEQLSAQLLFLENRVNYINEILNETIKLIGKNGREIEEMLETKGYSKLGETSDYKYLTRMFMDSVTVENVERINKELQNKREELDKIVNTTIEEFWLRELDSLEPKKRKIIIK